MDRRGIFLIIFILILLNINGCSLPSNQPTEQHKISAKLYYGSPGNERLVYEVRSITYNNPSDKYTATLNSLFLGPKDKSLVANIAPGTKVLSTTLEGKDLTVDLSKEFMSFAGSVGEIVAVGSIVNTLVEFPEVDRVKILVNGKELVGPSGMTRDFMTRFENNFEPATVTRDIVLYFGDQQAANIYPEPRQIRVKPNISEVDFIKTVLLELISGPKTGTLYRTIPQEANVLSVSREGDLVKVDFSSEIISKHWGGAAGEAMTVNSLTATLTELPGITRVLLTVEGKPMAIEHMVITRPLTRDGLIKP